MAATKIKHVYGNVMRLAIPLTLRTRMLINSVETESDTDFTDYKGEVIVRLYEKNRERRFVASMSGNVATIEDDGTTPIGTYNVEVLCRNTHDEPMRFMGRFLVQIVDATADAGIDPGIEFDAVTYALEGAIFLYAKGDKGDDGVGIEDIEVEQNASPNGANIVNITLTDGRVYTFQVRNGYGGTSGIIVNGALHTQRADGAIDIGTVIRSHQNLSNYVSESEFNTWIQSYYTKTQADNLLANKASTASVTALSERLTPVQVTFTRNTSGSTTTYTSDYTLAQINTNYSNHKPIVASLGSDVGVLLHSDTDYAVFEFADQYGEKYLLWCNHGTWNRIDGGGDIEIDDNPTEDSENAVSSGGVYAALSQKVSGISVNGGTTQFPTDGIVNLTVEGGGTGDVTGIKVGDDTYEPTGGVVDITDAIPDVSGKANSADLAAVATSGDYEDLANKPTIPAAQVQTDWNASSGMGVILNKPTLATVATSGAYSDLSGTPTIPTKVSDLTNDSGFTTNTGTLTGVTFNGTSANVSSGVASITASIPTVDAALGTTSQANAVQGGAIVEALDGKEDTLTWDSVPTSSSTNPVTSGGVYTALAGKQDTISGLATITANAGKGVADVTASTGAVTITLANGDTYIIDLNHSHPTYAVKKTVENNTDATVTLSADVIYDLGAVSGNKTINLPTTVDEAADYEFRLTYTSGTISGTAISGTTVANDATLTFTAGKTYQVIVSGGILYFSETTVSA